MKGSTLSWTLKSSTPKPYSEFAGKVPATGAGPSTGSEQVSSTYRDALPLHPSIGTFRLPCASTQKLAAQLAKRTERSTSPVSAYRMR